MKQSILVIDDEPHMVKLLERIISERTPYDITPLDNSLQVPGLLKEKEYDLIISDLKMPGMDGIDLLKHVKDNNRSELVIIITAFGSLDTAMDALSLGVYDYITKPFKKEQIIHTVTKAMNWQRLRKESDRIKSLMEREPFKDAATGFKEEYIRWMIRKYDGNIAEIARRSGLDTDDIAAMIDK